MNFLLKLALSTIAVIVSAYVIPGVRVYSFFTAFMVAVVLSMLNVFLKPLLIILTIPITLLTLGLFLLVINGLLILLTAHIVKGFYVDGFWHAFLFSIILSAVNYLLERML